MPDHVYRSFAPSDLFDTKVRAEPSVWASSGSTGWTGSGNGPSGSLSLYGGIRARTDVFGPGEAYRVWQEAEAAYNLAYNTLYSGTNPISASGLRSFFTFESGTYPTYYDSAPTSSFTMSFFSSSAVTGALGTNTAVKFTSGQGSGSVGIISPVDLSHIINGDWTFDAWIKLTGTNNGAIWSVHNAAVGPEFQLRTQNSGSNSVVGFQWRSLVAEDHVASGGFSNATSSWHHIAVSFTCTNPTTVNSAYTTGTTTLYLDGVQVLQTESHHQYTTNATVLSQSRMNLGKGYADTAPSGGIIDNARLVYRTLTPAEISSTYAWPPVYSPPAAPPVNQLQLYPIDLVDTHSIDKVVGIPGTYPATGSIQIAYCTDTDAPDLSSITQTRWYDEHYRPLSLLSHWYNQNVNSRYSTTASLPSVLRVVSVPSMFYGRHIATGSLVVTDKSYGASGTLVFVDDGHGSIILSGTDLASGTYGNVFYNEGFVVFTSHSLGSGSGGTEPKVRIDFRGVNIINSRVLMCRLGPGDANASNNPTFYTTDDEGKRRIKRPGKTYVTSIGIYNEERELVGVAKLAQPIRKREADDIDIRLRIDI